MNVSKSSWHYRFNDYFQSNFGSRVDHSTFTTCSYIRTTVRTAFQAAFVIAATLLILVAIGTVLGSGIYLPIALAFGLPMATFVGGFALITYVALITVSCAWVYESKLKPVLEARREQKLSLLRQAVLDRKEGICTIVRFE